MLTAGVFDATAQFNLLQNGNDLFFTKFGLLQQSSPFIRG